MAWPGLWPRPRPRPWLRAWPRHLGQGHGEGFEPRALAKGLGQGLQQGLCQGPGQCPRPQSGPGQGSEPSESFLHGGHGCWFQIRPGSWQVALAYQPWLRKLELCLRARSSLCPCVALAGFAQISCNFTQCFRFSAFLHFFKFRQKLRAFLGTIEQTVEDRRANRRGPSSRLSRTSGMVFGKILCVAGIWAAP